MNPSHSNIKPPVEVVNHRLSNGLDVFYCQMPGFHEVCGAIATHFGSIHSGQPLDEANPQMVVPQERLIFWNIVFLIIRKVQYLIGTPLEGLLLMLLQVMIARSITLFLLQKLF